MGFRIGIDLGGTKTESVLLDATGAIVERRRTPTPAADGYEAVLDEIERHVAHLDALAGERSPVGAGTPGAIEPATGLLKNSNTACLRGRPLHADLERRLAREVHVANDANCFALAEACAGAGRGARVVFGVILGTGVGGGVVIDGRPHVGRNAVAGEWGHSPIGAEAGPACYCGQRGCVETRLSGPGFEADYRRLAGLGVEEPVVRAPEIIARAEAGEPAACAAFDRYLAFFGEGLARVIHVLDPDAIVLGGGMSNVDALYTRGRDAVAGIVFGGGLRTPILRNALGDGAGVVGAAWLSAP